MSRMRVAMVGTLALGLAACGGGERQDADEPAGSFDLEITKASFPAKQTLADKSTLRIAVRNADSEEVPEVSVTVATQPGRAGGAPQAFSQDIANPDVSDPSRPVWIVDEPPRGGQTAYTNTWSLGPLAPGETKTFKWEVTAVKAGEYTIDYSASPGLTGKARPAGDTKGSFDVVVDDRPPRARVDADGDVVRIPAN